MSDPEGAPHRALPAAIEEQADVVRARIAQQYEDWFIETCAPAAIPYLGDLVGYQSPSGIGPGTAPSRCEVANFVGARRRSGTLGVLETIARDVTGWDAIAFECERAVAATFSPIVRPGARERTLDVRDGALLANLRDVRSPAARGTAVRGISALGTVGLCVARLRACRVSRSDAARVTGRGDRCYTFDALGFDVPLVSAAPPLAARLLPHDLVREYGADKSVAIWISSAADGTSLAMVPPERIIAADLQHWRFPPPGRIAVDVERGRLAFAPGLAPSSVAVRYFYHAAADLGAGEYARAWAPVDSHFPIAPRRGEERDGLRPALARWQAADPSRAVITFSDSHVYHEGDARIELAADQSLDIRAEDGARPILRFDGRGGEEPGGLFVRGGPGSSLVLDGLLIARGGLEIAGDVAQVTIRRCTLVPGACPIVVHAAAVQLVIEQSIVGNIRTLADGSREISAAVSIVDSIVDAQGGARAIGSTDGRGSADAIASFDGSAAFVNLSAARSTIFGHVRVHAVSRIENAIFTQPLWVRRRDVGCVRFSYLTPQSRTPRRAGCVSEPPPTFVSRQYGSPEYARLSRACARAIADGAEDRGEMGVFFKARTRQKVENLRRRLAENVPPGVRFEIRYVGEQ